MFLTNHIGLCCLIASAALGTALTPLVIWLSRSAGLVDLPNARKVHHRPVPRLGGLAIAMACVLPVGLLMILNGARFGGPQQLGATLTLIFSAVALGLVGFLDDLLNIPAKYKLLALLTAGSAVCGSGAVIRGFQFEGHFLIHFGSLAWPITLLWLVGVTVGTNFIDGLDGLAGGVVAMAALVLAVCVNWGHNAGLGILPLALVGALLGFLVFNTHPAKIFMGDCGSMFIGFLFAGCCVIAQSNVGTTRGLLLPALALAIPIFDTFFTLVRRGVLQRRSLFSAERGHIHHRLLDIGLCQFHVVLILYAVTGLGACVAVVSLLGNPWATGISAAAFCFGLIVLFRIAGTVRARETLSAIRRNRGLARESNRQRVVFEELQLGFREVSSFDAWWAHVCEAAQLLGFAKLNLPLVRRDGTSTTLKWRRDDEELAQADSITAEIPIPQRRNSQSLRIGAEVAVGEHLESAGQRLAMFSRLISECSLGQLPDSSSLIRKGLAIDNEQMPDPQYADVQPLDGKAKSEFSKLRVCIVHDFLYTYAGAEKVLEQLIAMFPACDLYSIFDFLPAHERGFIQNKKVQTTFIQRMPGAQKHHRMYLPLFPLAIEQLDLSDYDLVISSSYVAAKGVLTKPDQLHICYCHTPVRYAWDLQNQYLGQVSGFTGFLKRTMARILLHYVRIWDVQSANHVDVFVTNSDFVGHRITKCYRRETLTIHPPVDTNWFTLETEKEDFFLTASRMVPYKRMDLIVEAFSQMPDRRLIVVGEGPEMDKIRAKAGPNVKLVGYQSAARLRHYLQKAKAFVFAAEEDFGIVPVEAQACGTPVICFGKGGVTESVIDGKTGIHFHEQTTHAIVEAIKRFDSQEWDAKEIRRNAERFSIRNFRQHFAAIATSSLAGFKAPKTKAQPNATATANATELSLHTTPASRRSVAAALANITGQPTHKDVEQA